MSVTKLLMLTITTPDLDDLAASWTEISEYQTSGTEKIGASLRSLWGAAADAHDRGAVFQAPGSSRGLVRFVNTDVEIPRDEPESRHGPLGLEFFSRSVNEAYARVQAEGSFRAFTPPVDYDMTGIGSGLASSFAAIGPGGLWFLVTTMQSVPPPRPLPTVEQVFGPVINMPITASDPGPVGLLYGDILGMSIRFAGTLKDAQANSIVGIEPERSFEVAVYSLGDGQMVEHHFHPPGSLLAPIRPTGRLRPGPAALTFEATGVSTMIERASSAGFTVRGPVSVEDHPYRGRNVAAIEGPNSELVELIETEA